jgi:hypothetical protein
MNRTNLAGGLTVLLVSVAFFACGDDDEPSGPVVPLNEAGVGNACTKNEDCPTNNCYLGPGGGYCTTTCSNEGSTSQCPLDTVCKPIQGGARRCLLICGSASTCRDTTAPCVAEFCPRGSSCISVSNSSEKACEPDPG